MSEQIFSLTKAAAEKIEALIAEDDVGDMKLRVFVSGGGCSGFQYGFVFDKDQNEDDTIMKFNNIEVIVDAISGQYLVGAEIDYVEGIGASQFVVNNPNASTTCGCGSSFSV